MGMAGLTGLTRICGGFPQICQYAGVGIGGEFGALVTVTVGARGYRRGMVVSPRSVQKLQSDVDIPPMMLSPGGPAVMSDMTA